MNESEKKRIVGQSFVKGIAAIAVLATAISVGLIIGGVPGVIAGIAIAMASGPILDTISGMQAIDNIVERRKPTHSDASDLFIAPVEQRETSRFAERQLARQSLNQSRSP